MKRLKDGDIPGSSSEDEDPDSVALHAAVLQYGVHAPGSHSESPYSKAEIRAALKTLPRPSEVVPELDAGSASDAGCSKELKLAHKRRVKSTEISIQYLNKDGTQDPVPPWTLDLCGLKRYTRYMIPPPEDQNIKPHRVPLAFLSRSYRGSFLRSHKIGTDRGTRRKPNWKGRPKARRKCSERSQSERGSVAEIEYWPSATDSDIHSCRRTTVRPTKHDNLQRSERQRTNREVVKELLAENASGSSDSDVDEKSSSEESVAKSVSPPGPSDTLRGEKEPRDHLSELFKMIEDNTTSLFKNEAEHDDEAQNANTEELSIEKDNGKKKTDAVPSPGNDVSIVPAGNKLSEFEIDKQVSATFCGELGTLKRPRSSVQLEILKMEPDRTRARLSRPGEGTNEERTAYEASSKSLRMMKKMGFKGRLGAKEDGILEPIKARSTEGRFGLGMRSERDVVMGKPMAKLPSSFKGRNVEVGALKSNDGNLAGTQRSDAFVIRKQSNNGTVDLASDSQAELGEDQEKGRGQMDDSDEYESEQEEADIDNGRRALLIDFDVLMHKSGERRAKAFQKAFECIETLAEGANLTGTIGEEKRDLSDGDLVSKILHSAGLETEGVAAEKLQDGFDNACREGDEPEWNHEVIQMLKYYSKRIHFGLLHKGSRSRMNQEMELLGSVYPFLRGPRVTVKHGDEWPYSETWRDLLCRVGVRPRQALFLVNGQDLSGVREFGGVVSSFMVGALPIMLESTECGNEIRMFGNESCGDAQSAVTGKDHVKILDDFLESRRKAMRRRRVMALYSADELWYAGREEFSGSHGYGKGRGSSLICFYGYGNREWVEKENVLPLTRKNFCKMRDAGFAGIFDPADVEDM